jgi:hypothetical protein
MKRSLRGKCQQQILLELYRAVAMPILLYGSESWMLTKITNEKNERQK